MGKIQCGGFCPLLLFVLYQHNYMILYSSSIHSHKIDFGKSPNPKREIIPPLFDWTTFLWNDNLDTTQCLLKDFFKNQNYPLVFP